MTELTHEKNKEKTSDRSRQKNQKKKMGKQNKIQAENEFEFDYTQCPRRKVRLEHQKDSRAAFYIFAFILRILKRNKVHRRLSITENYRNGKISRVVPRTGPGEGGPFENAIFECAILNLRDEHCVCVRGCEIGLLSDRGVVFMCVVVVINFVT